jgi:RNA 2',3'-cyclic 3'-phosphodiesterase
MKLRLFVALDLPAAARAALAAFRDAAADPAVWRPLADDSLHLTLAFLGHRPEADVPALVDILRTQPQTAPRLVLGAPLALPPRRPRVLTAEVLDPDGTLGELQAAVSRDLAAAGLYEPETRPYRPHATVARLRPDARARRADLPAPERREFHGEALTLYQSRLRRGGARYEPLARFELSV